MIPFLLGVLFSGLGTWGGPIALVAGAVALLVFVGRTVLTQIAAGALVVAALCWFCSGLAFQAGSEITAARYEAAADAERERQAKANETARAEGAKIIADLQEKNRDLSALLAENAEAAARDPDGARACVSPGGVLRLNKIR